MKKSLAFLSSALLLTTAYLAGNGENLPKDFSPKQSKAIAFTENKGQVYDQNYKARPDVLYGAMTGNLAVHIKKTGVSYQLYRVDEWKEVEDKIRHEKRKEIEKQSIYRIDLNWLNANTNFKQSTDEALPGYNNYYLESCPNGALNVKSYTGITLHNLYNGINLHYYEKNGELKHDYIVAPHADYKQIQIEMKGAVVSVNKDGSLTFKTPLGDVQEGRPIVYQRGRELKAKWQLEKNVLSFNVESVDPNYELIIDPVTRLWGTYYGGSGVDYGNSCASDAAGNVYLAGYTTSNAGTIIATAGAHQTTYGGNNDVFLVKFNGAGVRQWGTYLGDSYGGDYGYSCATDASGNIYITGTTDTFMGTVIATMGSHQSNYGGGSNDAFLVKFNSSGIRQWGTYYGGNNYDYAYSCATDVIGNVYIAGYTESGNGNSIATAGAHQSVYGGSGDAFVARFNSSGTRIWGTYYGGMGYDIGFNCAIDASLNVYLTGRTETNTGTNIATSGGHQNNYAGLIDAFLVKFNSNCVRQWGTYYGSNNGADYGYACSVDASGNVYMAGKAAFSTGTTIATSGAHQSGYAGGDDAYLVKFSNAGVRQWGTYYGGSSMDEGRSCPVDVYGNVYLAGMTMSGSGTAIATLGSHQSVHGGGNDAFLAKFSTNGSRLWSTYYGGSSGDYGYSCALASPTEIFLAGFCFSNSGTDIATLNAHQNVSGGLNDAFLVKFIDCIPVSPTATVSNIICSGGAISFSCNITNTLIPSYTWLGPNGFTANIQNPIITNSSTIHIGIYTVTVNNGGCIETSTIQITAINPQPIISVNSGTICSGKSFTIVPSGALTYSYQGGTAVVTPTANSSYTVTGTSSLGCMATTPATANIIVNPLPIINITAISTIICVGEAIELSATGANSYTWSTGANGSSITVSPVNTSTYMVTGEDANACVNTSAFTLQVDECTGIANNSKSEAGIMLYPNPNNGLLNVELPYDAKLIILNTLGQIVYSSMFNAGQHQINLEYLAAGVYVLKVQKELSSQNFNIIKR